MVHIPSPPRPSPAQVPPTVTDPQIRENAANTLGALKGFGSTILTSGQGDTSTPTIAKKQLTGG